MKLFFSRQLNSVKSSNRKFLLYILDTSLYTCGVLTLMKYYLFSKQSYIFLYVDYTENTKLPIFFLAIQNCLNFYVKFTTITSIILYYFLHINSKKIKSICSATHLVFNMNVIKDKTCVT